MCQKLIDSFGEELIEGLGSPGKFNLSKSLM